MPWLLIWLLIMAGLILLLKHYAKEVDEIEDDSSYLFENEREGGYGSKFLNILLFRDRE